MLQSVSLSQTEDSPSPKRQRLSQQSVLELASAPPSTPSPPIRPWELPPSRRSHPYPHSHYHSERCHTPARHRRRYGVDFDEVVHDDDINSDLMMLLCGTSALQHDVSVPGASASLGSITAPLAAPRTRTTATLLILTHMLFTRTAQPCPLTRQRVPTSPAPSILLLCRHGYMVTHSSKAPWSWTSMSR